MQDQYHRVVSEYEENMKIHEENAIKYKKERESLAGRISEQTREIEMMESFIEKLGKGPSKGGEGEKITVHVKQDGTYQKTVEKLPPPKAGNQQPSNLRKKR